MFRPIDYNALGREFRPGKPLSTEIRRRIVDLYLRGPERRGTKGNLTSSSCYFLLMAEPALFVIIKRTRTAHILPLIKADEEILLNFQTTL